MARKGKQALCFCCKKYKEGTRVIRWFDKQLHVICQECKPEGQSDAHNS